VGGRTLDILSSRVDDKVIMMNLDDYITPRHYLSFSLAPLTTATITTGPTLVNSRDDEEREKENCAL